MKHAAETALRLTGFCWAQCMLVLGLLLLMPAVNRDNGPAFGLALVAAGLFLAMWLVIDRLVPDASRFFTGTLKLVLLVVFYACGSAALYGWSATVG